ncbi:unnamed protein product [Polarella glacialis]|uniref:YchJ-like middle NTF2-like domain-containing protein n=1 Tax=Polarella glacialis TaxID=89957 RepID=A0A813GDS2_POLGL|nr:unnamed protein product [Polarella glacialis]
MELRKTSLQGRIRAYSRDAEKHMRGRRLVPLISVVAACAVLARAALGVHLRTTWLTFSPSAPVDALYRACAGQSRFSTVARAGAGFGETPLGKEKRKRKKVDVDLLKADHGEEEWETVHRVLLGEPAQKPEDMVRARFSACRLKDPLFMARTELDDTRSSVEKRARGWAVTFGQEERKEYDPELGPAQKLRSLVGLEIIESDGESEACCRSSTVEFKLDCGEAGVLHERSIMEKDEKWGYVYSGKSVFDKWDEALWMATLK